MSPSAERAAALRRKFDDAGLYGLRAAVYVGEPSTYPFPPYLANLVVARIQAICALGGNSADAEPRKGCRLARHDGRDPARRLFRLLRPYGGTACLTLPGPQGAMFAKAAAGITGCPARSCIGWATWCNSAGPGPLPAPIDWTHEGANAANSGATRDQIPGPPLGLLWFDGTLRRFREPGGAVIRVAGGRVVILADRVLAIDAFTGRHLWETPLPRSPYLPCHELVVMDDAVYVAHARTCLVLDPATGKQVAQIDIPGELLDKTRASWSQLRVSGDRLVGAVGKYLVCVDRRTGHVHWKSECQHSQLSLAVGNGRVYCAELPVVRRKGEPADACGPRTTALDLATGQVLWQIPQAAVVRFSSEHDWLVTAQGIYRGEDGTLVRATGVPTCAGR